MSISFRCEHCGKKVEAPDSAGGKRGRCPYCKQSCYVPSPVSEDEILELAPEEEDRSDGAEEEKVRQHEWALRAEMGGEAAPIPLDHKEDLKSEDLHHLVVNYCLDMADSKLDRAKLHLAELKKVRHTAREAVDDFLTGKVLEPALDTVPPKLLQGFLNQLREELK